MLIEWSQRVEIGRAAPRLTKAQEARLQVLLERAVARAIEATVYGGRVPPAGGEARTVRTTFGVST